MPGYDVFVYHDLSDPLNVPINVGDNASKLAFGSDLEIVAIGPPIHASKDRTVVVAHGPGPMREVQALLDSQRQERTLHE